MSPFRIVRTASWSGPGPTGSDVTGDYSFGPEIAVYAFPGDGSTIHGRKLIEIRSPDIPMIVNLTIR